jgi:hypothetical protein
VDSLLDAEQSEELETTLGLLARYAPLKRACDSSDDKFVVSARSRRAHDLLAAVLEQGLSRRIGHQLRGAELSVYQYLQALGYETNGLRVCEECCLVFRASRTWRCLRCRRSAVRTNRQPWHLEVRPADRAAVPRAATATTRRSNGSTLIVTTSRPRTSAKTTYIVSCQSCPAEFAAREARVRYCPTCAAPAARVARSHARR